MDKKGTPQFHAWGVFEKSHQISAASTHAFILYYTGCVQKMQSINRKGLRGENAKGEGKQNKSNRKSNVT